MPRCGCSSTCGCALEVKPPLHKEGEGSARDQWILSLRYKGKEGAEALAALMCEAVGPGLVCDEGGEPFTSPAMVAARRGTAKAGLAKAGETRLMAKISTDAGNRLRFGSDDGLLVTDGGGGGDGPNDPETCGKSLDTLPDTGVTGAYLLAGLLNPFNSPYGLQYCIASNIDIAHVRCVSTADEVAWLAEYSSGNVTSSRSSAFVSAAASTLDAATIASTYNTAGNPEAPQPGKAEGRPDGGWYGWLAQKYHNWLLPELLERANGKLVVLADCLADDAEGSAVEEAANVLAVVRAGKLMCAQQRMLVGVEKLANAEMVVNHGFQPIMMPRFEKGELKVGETEPPYSVDDLTGAEVGWVALSEKYDDEVFAAYKEADISVLMVDSSRQYLAERAKKVARGRLGLDPVYARGVEPYDYRGQVDVWGRKRMCLGQLSHNTDNYEVTGTMPRGYTKLDSDASGKKSGLVIPARFGAGYGRPAILVGARGPVDKPDEEYTITWRAQAETLPTGATNAGKFGILFCAETDRGPLDFPQDSKDNPSGWPRGAHEMYRAYLRVDGRLGIGVWDEEGEYQMKEVETAKPKTNTWMEFVVTVTPEEVSLERKGDGGGKVTAKSTRYRGPYLFIEKEELHPEDDKYGFRAGFTMPKVGR